MHQTRFNNTLGNFLIILGVLGLLVGLGVWIAEGYQAEQQVPDVQQDWEWVNGDVFFQGDGPPVDANFGAWQVIIVNNRAPAGQQVLPLLCNKVEDINAILCKVDHDWLENPTLGPPTPTPEPATNF